MTNKYDASFQCPACRSTEFKETREEYQKYTRNMVNGVPSDKDYSVKNGDRLVRAECLNCGEMLYKREIEEEE